MEKDISTEERIKKAAEKIFMQKGYAGTRTRDIAEEAGINLALLNYYYRSKEKLFEQIMEKSIKEFFLSLKDTLYDAETSLLQKIYIIVDKYVDMLSSNPNLPIFILSEIQANPEKFTQNIGLSRSFITDSFLYKQGEEYLEQHPEINMNPINIPVNILAMTLFPFVAKPLIKNLGSVDEAGFSEFIEERRKLIPIWIKSILHLDE